MVCGWPCPSAIAVLNLLFTANVRIHLPLDLQMWFVAGLFTLLALPVSIYEVAMHLEYFTRPKLQIRVIRILWMVPIYAIDCFLSLTPQFHVGWQQTALTLQGVGVLMSGPAPADSAGSCFCSRVRWRVQLRMAAAYCFCCCCCCCCCSGQLLLPVRVPHIAAPMLLCC